MLLTATADVRTYMSTAKMCLTRYTHPGGVDGTEAAAHQLFSGGQEDEVVSKLNRVCTELLQSGPHLHATEA